MKTKSSGSIVLQVAQQFGCDGVKASDFVAVGYLRATNAGIARCQTEDFARTIHTIAEHKGKNTQDGHLLCSVYTAGVVCADKDGCFLAGDDDWHEFIDANMKPLSRLILPALATNYPGVIKHLGL
jgi:hypothetical protein